MDKIESLKYDKNHEKNRTARCGRIILLGIITRRDTYKPYCCILPKLVEVDAAVGLFWDFFVRDI
jgi:hypothetical protein